MDFAERFERFKDERYPSLEGLFKGLVEKGQSPRAMVISCCDSRIVPELIMDCDPGEIFVVRNIANIAPPYHESRSVASAVDFAVETLKVKVIIVLGHSQCGGLQALLEGKGEGDTPIAQWISMSNEALRKVEERGISSTKEKSRALEIENVKLQVERLKEYPSVKAAVANGELEVEGWYYQMVPPRVERVMFSDENSL